MKFRYILFFLLFCFVNSSNAQIYSNPNQDSFKIIRKSVSIDTALIPDFYYLEFSITEYYVKNGSRRKINYHKFNMDSIKYSVKKELSLLGFNDNIELIHIAELKSNYYWIEDFPFELSFRIKLDSINLVDSIFNRFQTRFKMYFTGMKLIPVISNEKLESLKLSLEKIYVNKFKTEIMEADKLENLKSVRVSVYNLNFFKKHNENPYSRNEYGQLKKFNISYLLPIYVFNCNIDFYIPK